MQMASSRVRVAVDGHMVVAETHGGEGQQPPVVFLHGILASVGLVRQMVVEPASETWISISLPGHAPGRLAPGTTAADIDTELFVRLTEAAIDAVVGDRPVVMSGWSLGGFAALAFAAHRPQRVVGVASLAGFTTPRVRGTIGAMERLSRSGLGTAVRAGLWLGARFDALHDLIARSCAADWRAATAVPEEVLAGMRADFAAHDPASLLKVLAAIHALDITAVLPRITAPAWIVAGGRDPLIRADEARRIASLIPQSTLTIYPSGGHLFFCEWPGLRDDFAAWRASLPHVVPRTAGDDTVH